ncbi:MAG: SulP family inorganic anion transporter [Amaricoccus sp.]
MALAPNPEFVPKLITTLGEGYGPSALRADALAGLTVAIVALPLSMAIAIASGVPPATGLVTAIVGGFLVSALGGSRFQIGGPAGAFIVLVSSTVATQGIQGLVLATLLSGGMLAALGLLRLGTYVKFIPFPVTVGFTAGIGTIIFASQIKPLLGLTLSGPEPGALVPKLKALGGAIGTASPATCALSLGCILALLALKRWRPRWPRMLIVVAAAAFLAWAAALPVDTIFSVFGALPAGLPAPQLPSLSLDAVTAALPTAVSFTLLGAIESLLSAVVADGMTGRRHRSNTELIAQGVANIGSALFGGIPVTGTIARTATNVRAGAHGPVSGMLHSVFLLVFLMVAAPLAGFIPLAALAAVLALVAWDMVEKPAFAALTRASWGDAAVLYVTLLLTVFRDVATAITVGFALGAALFIHRMSSAVEVESDREDPIDEAQASDPQVLIYRISGAIFFGAVSAVATVLERIGDQHRVLVIDLTDVTLVDSSAANMIEGLAHKAERRGVAVYLTGTTPELRRSFMTHGARPPLVRYTRTVDRALEMARRRGQLAPAAA